MLDYEQYGLTEAQARAVGDLTPGQLNYACDKTLRLRQAETTKRHAQVLLDDRPGVFDALSDSDFEAMAERYACHYDSGASEDAQMADAVWEYLRSTGKA